jgi:hypothetical protein
LSEQSHEHARAKVEVIATITRAKYRHNAIEKLIKLQLNIPSQIREKTKKTKIVMHAIGFIYTEPIRKTLSFKNLKP